MRLLVDEEPTFDDISERARQLYGTAYIWLVMWTTSAEENIRRVDMECVAERELICERQAKKQTVFE